MKSFPARNQTMEQLEVDFQGGTVNVSMAPPSPAPSFPATGFPSSQNGKSGDSKRDALAGVKLLIVEDEYLIAQDLAYGPQREGIEVLGPCNTIDGAIDIVQTTDDIGAAILDLNIRGHLAFDLAEKLIERNIPFVFYTGYESVIIPEKFRKVSRVRKPADWSEIKQALFDNGKPPAGPGKRLVKQLSLDAPTLASLLPALQRRAREITASHDLAERLVERTLERAIGEIGACPIGVPMDHWLIGLLESTGIGDRHHLN